MGRMEYKMETTIMGYTGFDALEEEKSAVFCWRISYLMPGI